MTAPRLGDVLAERVRTFRLRRGWSFPRLAEECARHGAPELTVSSLTNIERTAADKRGRRKVTVEELAALAKALQVPMVALLVDPAQRELAVTPTTPVATYDAVLWMLGHLPLPEDRAGVTTESWTEQAATLARIWQLGMHIADRDLAAKDGGERYAEWLRLLYRFTALLPPGVPAPALLDEVREDAERLGIEDWMPLSGSSVMRRVRSGLSDEGGTEAVNDEDRQG